MTDGKPLRPRDAATVLILRFDDDKPRVLMGERSAKHVFVPNNYVFPGGRVDRADGYVRVGTRLRPETEARLTAAASAHRAHAIAMAAVRETYEETGLILGVPGEAPPRAHGDWADFFATGYVPALDRMSYVARAITPTGRPRRFDARFFVMSAQDAVGEACESSELGILKWVTLDEARALKIRPVTKLVLDEVESRIVDGRFDDTDRPVPVFQMRNGKRLIHRE